VRQIIQNSPFTIHNYQGGFMEILQQLFPPPPIPTLQQAIFLPMALFTAVMALTVVLARNLFHSALALVGSFFGVTGVYVMLEAEFLAVSQVLIYVGAISTLITFAIMLTRGMMYGATSPNNRQWLTAALMISLFGILLMGLVAQAPWPTPEALVDLTTLDWGGHAVIGATTGEQIIARLGYLFVTDYLLPFELMALLLLVALAGAILLARDRKA
jgi:NADH:ubiquinone oxidoreductase subunit 6 (subunit J)